MMSNRAVLPRFLRLAEAEIVQQEVTVPPVVFHLDPALQVHLRAEEFLAVQAGLGGDLFQHLPALADDHALVALALAVDVHINVDDVPVGALLEPLHRHRDAVGDLYTINYDPLDPDVVLPARRGLFD